MRAVPRQSLRARSKCESAPGPPGAPGTVAAMVRTCVDGVVGEGHRRARDRDVERDVRPVRHPALAVVLVPALVDRDLPLVRALRQRRRLERVDPVAVGVLQPGAEAARIPVARAAELGLEASRRDGDDRAPVVRGPVALVVVVELDARPRREVERDVRAVGLRVSAVVLVPRVVERGLVLEAARRERERPLPDVVARVVRQMGRRALRLPVTGTAELRLQRAGDRHGGGGRSMRRGRRRKQHERRGEHEQHPAKAPHSGRSNRTGDPPPPV